MEPAWYIYLGVFISPFVQEDAAVIAAATLSASNPQEYFPIVFVILVLGLFFSDIWKYWIGYSAHASSRARKWAEKDKVMAMSEKIQRHAITTLLTARFLPFARMPAYIACGYFKMNYVKFCTIIFGTALLYASVIFALIHLLGEVFGDKMEIILGIFACIAIIAIVIVFGVGGFLKARKNSDEIKSEEKKSD